MLRIFGWISLGLLSIVGLLYASAFGFGVCIGLMTWNLPPFCQPILRLQPFVWFGLGFGVPIAGSIHFQKHRQLSVLLGFVAATVWMWWLPLVRINWPLRHQGLQQSAARMSVDLVENLEKYRRKNGHYPATLSELGVPVATGMVSYSASKLKYQRATAQSPFVGYEIRVPTLWGMGFDSFFYWPSETYPPRIYGGSTEIIQAPRHRWAYVHE